MRKTSVMVWMLGGCLAALGCDDDGATADNQETPIDASVADMADPEPEGQPEPGPEGQPEPGPDGEPEPGPEGEPEPLGVVYGCEEEGQIVGQLYTDEDGGDRSRYLAEVAADDAAVKAEMTLIGPDGPQAFSSCDDGRFSIDGLTDGAWLLVPPAEGRCSRRNCARNFAAAVQADGSATIVTIGDSVPVIGDQPPFPDRIKTLFEGVAEIESRNIAVPGAVSPEWVPGTNYYARLEAELDDADVVIISIGGNDILGALNDPAIFQDIPGAIEDTRELVVEIAGRVVDITRAIHSTNPNIDVIFALYPDYTQATGHQLWGLARGLIGVDTMREILEGALHAIPEGEAILVADMRGALLGVDLTTYLYDALHFSDPGQNAYAEEIFEVLGGVLVGDSPLGEMGQTPLGAERAFGFGAGE